jgi:hypothetical protein
VRYAAKMERYVRWRTVLPCGRLWEITTSDGT